MTIAANQPTETDLIMAAVAIVPGPDDTVTFVLQNCGSYAGHWLLPGGHVDPGETAEDAARREAAEEAGVVVGELAPVGVYDIRGEHAGEPYAFRLHVFRALEPCVIPPDFVMDPMEVSDIGQMRPSELLPHPTDMRILNDAGYGDYDPELIERLLAADGVRMDYQGVTMAL
ncbi:NUDIX hydrolase [Marinitenerispora sediminis]|uniref:NUDIX hydrolase n=1 Tax=Marinitenerispora sediminis TaxID=1931232 RepID=A0A368TA24_9ACTN|nr:NUDIX hydrolase [Marinitenerispora sediminis]RCV52795.1 NUDIX hydrolase [Marinitenerispora sediminis]RCV59900.1 NUDIX hydrolase [Marinitenerispora sediminis]RCV61316.1 NUDIX hydrolase [Marinitenerispora sediminis]